MKSAILSHTDKPSRQKAFDILMKQKLMGGVATLSLPELDSLINYFAPPLPTKAKDVFGWVAKAAAVSDIRECLQFVYVKDGNIVATDGARIHRGKTELPDGYYDPKTRLILSSMDRLGKYPDIERLFNRKDQAVKYEHPLDEIPTKIIDLKNKTNARVKTINGSVNVDEKYFLAAELESLSVYTPEQGSNEMSMVFGHNRFGEYIIATIRA